MAAATSHCCRSIEQIGAAPRLPAGASRRNTIQQTSNASATRPSCASCAQTSISGGGCEGETQTGGEDTGDARADAASEALWLVCAVVPPRLGLSPSFHGYCALLAAVAAAQALARLGVNGRVLDESKLGVEQADGDSEWRGDEV